MPDGYRSRSSGPGPVGKVTAGHVAVASKLDRTFSWSSGLCSARVESRLRRPRSKLQLDTNHIRYLRCLDRLMLGLKAGDIADEN